ncbi:MAG: endonuclease/exonuclease/phosphatase family protein, partial [Bacteroidetes bacterium]|nr:endonuclease/exonuclease/phosphatase family protein [Bacteroidota bacterium]
MKTFLKISLVTISILVLLFVFFLVIFTITDYEPDATFDIHNTNHPDTLKRGDTLSIITWNIGYAGLGDEMDFFYDGGEQVRTTNENTRKNLSEISNFLINTSKPDFILLQEVDKKAKRTFFIDETKHLAELFKDLSLFFAPNYNVRFVPLPVTSPMGFVHSGLLSLSGLNPSKSVRLDLPGEYSWPMKVFMLDRCILLNRYPLNNGNEFVLLNIHNSAFDDGSLKKQEMDFIRNLVIKEYEKGNYIAAGGDWNQNPPGLKDNKFNKPDGYD